jgi:hypothetical protein
MSALAFDNTYLPVAETRSRAYLDQNKNIREINIAGTRRSTRHDGIDLGLKSGLKLTWDSDGKPFPSGIQSLLHRLRMFEDLPLNWDSYGALPHNPSSQKPALDLIFYSHSRCSVPSIIPLHNGGIGLRWQNNERELEIDVNPDTFCSILFVDESAHVEDETENPIDVNAARNWLARYWRYG